VYIPHQFAVSDWEEIQRFVARVRSADLVTILPSGEPVATLMPALWIVESFSDGTQKSFGSLVMHMARANEQWKDLESGSKALAIIRGNQAYVSPENYADKELNQKVVPTWNYQSVHMTGSVEISEDTEVLRKVVSDLTDFHENSREIPWEVTDTDPKYLEAQLKMIVAVTLKIEKVEAKYKLSQNKSSPDRKRVIADLEKSKIAGEAEIAAAMQQLS
jgi:transcriptional regulator